MKLNLIRVRVSRADTVKVKFQITGDNMSSEEIFKFLQEQTADSKIKIKLNAEYDMYTFTLSHISRSSETTAEFISRIKNILDRLIEEDERREVMPQDQVERSLVLWLADKVLKGELKLK